MLQNSFWALAICALQNFFYVWLMNSLDEIETPQFHKLILAYVLIDCRDVLSFLHTLIQPTNDVAGAAKGQLISECL